uniref:Ankyrin repeat domain 10a n=1 Tax=Astatotilapia calliptera TaxID=8154 RepID=A0A3P8P1D1_ASTCA
MSGGLEARFSGDDVFVSRFPVHRACRDGDVGALVLLLQQLSNHIHLTAEDSFYGWTPIHWAAHYGQLECVMHLVEMGCEVNRVTSRFNQTPTHTAAFGGHPHCVVWLTQAGADVNKQDFVGEAPIHKAARSGSLECIQVLLIAGAKPHLENASGQTAADLAHAQGFHDCFCFISNAQKHLQQRNEGNIVQNGGGAPCGLGALSRKRQLAALDAGHLKKAKRADGKKCLRVRRVRGACLFALLIVLCCRYAGAEQRARGAGSHEPGAQRRFQQRASPRCASSSALSKLSLSATLSAGFSRDVRLAAPEQQPGRLRLQLARVPGANRGGLWGFLALWTLPWLWRHGRGAE